MGCSRVVMFSVLTTSLLGVLSLNGCVGANKASKQAEPVANAATVLESLPESDVPTPSTLASPVFEVADQGVRSTGLVEPGAKVVAENAVYDVVVIGGGVPGMTSALYLTNGGKKVLLLDRGPKLGVDALWSESRDHVRLQRNRPEHVDSHQETIEILKQLNLEPAEREPVSFPAGYFVRGKFHADPWNAKNLEKLPVELRLFLTEVRRAQSENKIPSPPFEEFVKYGGSMDLDSMNVETWIRSMPAAVGKRGGNRPEVVSMDKVVELADLYCRANFGADAKAVSAMAFASFFSADLEGRRSSVLGNDGVVAALVETLENRAMLFLAKVNAPVTSITQDDGGIEVSYNQGDESHRARGKYVVFAERLEFAPELIQGMEIDAEQVAQMKDTKLESFVEFSLLTSGQPYLAAANTWLQLDEVVENDITHLMVANWEQVAPPTAGLSKKQFARRTKEVKPEEFLVRQHLSAGQRGIGEANLKFLGFAAASRVEKIFSLFPRDLLPGLQGKFAVEKITGRRYLDATHAPKPGFFTTGARRLRRPVGRVFFASNSLGAPSMEEALFRGHCAASSILARINKAYRLESWSRCPLDPPKGVRP